MATSIQQPGSDLEMMSQTETEDTDSGEVTSESTASQSTSGLDTSDSTLDSSTSEDPVAVSYSKLNAMKPVNVSVDLTDVTELEDPDFGSGDSSTCSGHFKDNGCKNVENKTKILKKGLANLDFSSDWYNNECFSAYWKHYNEVMGWCNKHIAVYQKLIRKSSEKTSASTDQRFSSFEPYPQWYLSNSDCAPFLNHPCTYQQNIFGPGNLHKSSAKTSSRRKRKPRQRKPKHVSSSDMTSSETQTETSEEFQMEITQDMIDFFAKTQAHRKQRGKLNKSRHQKKISHCGIMFFFTVD